MRYVAALLVAFAAAGFAATGDVAPAAWPSGAGRDHLFPASDVKDPVRDADPPGVVPLTVAIEPAEDVPRGFLDDGPDVTIVQSPGKFAAVAADYQMDGTMWVATTFRNDSVCRVYKSTDHGYTWNYFGGFFWTFPTLMRKLQIVVGAGDSAKVFVFVRHADQSGDMICVRWNMDGSGLMGYHAFSGPDTVTDFAACRDYTTPYYLYAVAHNGANTSASPRTFICRSTTFGKTWVAIDTVASCDRPHLAAGAGNHVYLAGIPMHSMWKGWIACVISNSYGANGSWASRDVRPDTFPVYDAAVSPAFTTPPASATTWLAYSHYHQPSTTWDLLALHTTDAGVNWSGPTTVCHVPGQDAAYVDLKNYNQVGNTYMNLAYLRARRVYHHYVNAPTPTAWSDSLQLNQTYQAAYGINVGPALAYSPGGGSGGGAVWMSADSTRILWNAPWMTGVSERPGMPRDGAGFAVRPNPAFERLQFDWVGPAADVAVFDAAGREVARLRGALPGAAWDRRDGAGRRVAAGVYFVRLETTAGEETRPVILR
jgi:hypothetical protein